MTPHDQLRNYLKGKRGPYCSCEDPTCNKTIPSENERTLVAIAERLLDAVNELRTGIYHHTRATSICDKTISECAELVRKK